jgi:hypothetical protein
MTRKSKTAAQHLADLQDQLRWAIENEEDTSDLRAEIEQARVEVTLEQQVERLQK